jgi:hypothetical protein
MIGLLTGVIRRVIGTDEETVEATAETETARQPAGPAVSPLLGAPGRGRQTWETAVVSSDADLIIMEGTWPVPPRRMQ